MRAREPDERGYVERDGVRVGYEVFGAGSPTVLLLPTWSIVPSGVWKLQVPHLARRCRVITIDPRGNGRSDHPVGSAAYAVGELVQDALQVLDATGTPAGVVVALSQGNQTALRMAADHPDRVLGWVALGPYLPGETAREDLRGWFDADFGDDDGWHRYNRRSWLRDPHGFAEFFFSELLPEDHATKPREDAVAWAMGIEPERLVDTIDATLADDWDPVESAVRVTCPVLVLHGTDDRSVPPAEGERLATLTGGRFVRLEGSGHLPQLRAPVRVNHLLAGFVGSLSPPPPMTDRDVDPARPAQEDAMRARQPDTQGDVEVEGVHLAYETFNDAGTSTIVFAPIDTCVHSRAWKGQVPYLAQHYRVVTIDSPGNGRSGRSLDPTAYDDLALVADTLAVLDRLGIQQAVLAGICVSAWQALLTAALHPDRVQGVVAVAPWARDFTRPIPIRLEAARRFDDELDDYSGWFGWNRHYIPDHWPDYADFFFRNMLPEPHSTKQLEDIHRYNCDTSGPVMVAENGSRRHPGTPEEAEALLRGIDRPVLVIQGTDDRCQPLGRGESVVRWTGAEHLVLEGAGHLPMARHPVPVNRAIKGFVDRVTRASAPVTRRRVGTKRRPRALYLSSPIGLGHVRRDLAIADAMREQRPDLEVQWLTQSPVADFLERRGEIVHPASRLLASESGHIESESGEHDLHAFQAVRRMDEVLVNNFMVFDDLVERETFDLWLGDEAWDLDHFLHENPELKRAPFVWMTDFVGWVPMPDGGEREAFLTADYNAEMVEHVARYPALRDRSIFVGDPADVVDLPLGPDLPTARAWTEEHFDFAGYVMGERPDPADREALRHRLGYVEGEVVCVVSVGGSGVGDHLLRRVVASYDEARGRIPGLRMVVVAGPRIDPDSLGAPRGVEVHGFLPDLDLHHAACDVAAVQGGLSTTMELTAAGRPFVYFPLGHHFEQQVHVRHRLERHGAGRALDYRDADPGRIADALAEVLKTPTDYLPVPADGADRAAQLVLEVF